MKKLAISIALVLCAHSLSTYGVELRKPQDSSRDASRPPFVKVMPDFCQLNDRYGQLPGGGSQYCAPTAISNILVWLDQHGFPDLIPGDDNSSKAQYKLIRCLGSEDYMNTDHETGTSPIETMEGLERYVKDRGYNIILEWKGWRNGGRFAAKEKAPSVEWLKEGTQADSNIIISVGWYTLDKKKKHYNRLGGHYVTLVGVDPKAKNGPTIFIHNPSFGTEEGKAPKPQVCRLVPITEGCFGPWCDYTQHPAKGYFRIEGIPMRKDAKYAILDGAIRFSVLHRPPKNVTAVTPVKADNSSTLDLEDF